MNLGDLATVQQGEVRLITLPFAALLQSGETLSGAATAKMALWPYSPAPDANAANLVLGSPVISGSGVAALCGGYGAAGFQAGAIYSLWATVATSLGQTLEAYGQITCDALVPPSASSGGSLPNSTTSVTTNITASASTVYVLNAAGLTFTLPSSWGPNAGPVIVADNSGAGATISGPVKNWPLNATSQALGPDGSATFFWSSQLNGWVVL
jgi:hypothetical protein